MKLTLEYKKARKEGLVASRPSMARAQPRSHEPLGRFRSPMRPIVGHAIGQRPDTARYMVAGGPDALLALTSGEPSRFRIALTTYKRTRNLVRLPG